jgi:alkylation response protein AidB-like acyl-CoA dehydrogenase
MSHETRQWISYEALSEAAAVDAAERDADGAFPNAAFGSLRRFGLTGDPPLRTVEMARLLRSLAAVGRGNLSVGRIFEGHCNALFLIHLFGTDAQRNQFRLAAAGGALFGVWNTDAPADVVRIDRGELKGRKNFASGADGLHYAVITASTAMGRQMLIVPIKNLPVDRKWWRPLGMKASGSHVVSFDGLPADSENMIGGPDDYVKEPWFSAGAVRFLAVHVGGMHAILDVTLDHLRRTKRMDDVHQRHRLGKMASEVATGYAWLDTMSNRWSVIDRLPAENIVAATNAARITIENAALGVLETAERSVGAAGMIVPHPLERIVRDLRTYLRQPNPDAALAGVGHAVTEDLWTPGDAGKSKF